MFSVVRLSSNDPFAIKHNGTKLSDITFTLPKPIVRSGDQFEISTEYSASYSWYNIVDGDSLHLDPLDIVFTASNYNALSLVTAVNSTYPNLMSFNRETGKLTLTSDTALTLNPTALSIRLGFGTEIRTGNSIVGLFPANLNKTHSISIFSNIWTDSIDSVSHSSSLLLSSPVIAPPFTFFKVTSHSPVSGRAVSDLSNLRITILDRGNDTIDFNNQPWELVVYTKIISSITEEERQQAILSNASSSKETDGSTDTSNKRKRE